jgi:multiple sugar transport system permease protein
MIGAIARKRKLSNAIAGYVFIGPWLIGFFTLTLIPTIAVLLLGFTTYPILSAPKWDGLGNFIYMFSQDPRYWNSVKATLYFAFVSVPLHLAFALLIAMYLNTKHKALGLYRTLYYAPSIVGGSVAVAVMWRQVFDTRGLLNGMLAVFGVHSSIAWLGNPYTAIWTLIVLVIWQFGSPMLIFLAGLKQIPAELYESASIDGARPWKRFSRITLPLLTPIIFFNFVLQFIFGLTAFTQAFIVTGGAPLDTTNFYALYLYDRAFVDFQMGYGSAMAFVLLVIVALVTALVFKSSPYWVYYESEGPKR